MSRNHILSVSRLLIFFEPIAFLDMSFYQGCAWIAMMARTLEMAHPRRVQDAWIPMLLHVTLLQEL